MRSWRKRLDLTQEQAAEILGVTSRAVAKWEAEQAPIDKRTELATERYEQRHITRHGINGRPLLYSVYVSDCADEHCIGETYLVIARDDLEANKLVYDDLDAAQATLTTVWVAKAPLEGRPRILGTVAELARSKRTIVSAAIASRESPRQSETGLTWDKDDRGERR